MSHSLTRRDFLSDAAKAGVASALKLEISPIQKHEIENSPERRSSFDSNWRFFKGDAEDAYSPEFEDRHWRSIDLPHDWSIAGPFSVDAPAAGTGASLPDLQDPRPKRSCAACGASSIKIIALGLKMPLPERS